MRLGIDLGGTKIEGILLSPSGTVEQRLRVATPGGDYRAILEAIVDVIGSLGKSAGRQLPVGIGTPGAICPHSGLMKNCNSTCLNDQPLKEDIESLLGRIIRVENDANCFALSEAMYGAGKSFDSLFGVIIGTGTGAGLVINKRLIHGSNRIAGEWGHNPLPVRQGVPQPTLRHCYCGRTDCIETYLSGKGLVTTFNELGGNSITAQEIARNAQSGVLSCSAAVDQYITHLAASLSTVINIVDPDAIVFGGGLSNIAAIYQQIPQRILPWVFSKQLNTRFLAPQHGDASGAIGAACLWPDESTN